MADERPNNETVVLKSSAPVTPASERQKLHNALPIGTRMGEFELIGLVGEGGFGIVYLALDHSLERKVALKEYMPSSLAGRGEDSSVVVRSERHRETFDIGKRSFVNEARLLARFDHPSLVKVYRFWETNGTAYMAMPFYDGRTLRDVLRDNPEPPDEARLKALLTPVMEALAVIHEESCFHRDIAPDNIMLLRDGRPVLLDFGAARRVISDMTQALTVILKPGYAPIEQYAEMPGMKQGAWTDIYALAAVVYFSITRKLPPPSVSRIVQDNYEPLAQLAVGRYSEGFLRGIDHCLAVKAEHRPQTIAQMQELLGMGGAAQAVSMPRPVEPASKPVAANKLLMDRREPKQDGAKPRASFVPLLVVGVVFAVLGAVGWFVSQPADNVAPAANTLPTSSEASSAPLAVPAAVIAEPEPAPDSPADAQPLVAEPEPVEIPPQVSPQETVPVARKPESQAVKPVKPSQAEGLPPSNAEQKPSKPVAKPNNSGAGSRNTDDEKAEREYLRKLNQDLDNLLR